MKNIAEKFKAIGKATKSNNSASAIFGSASNMAQSIESKIAYRVGFYPILSNENPELAMGIASCLCYLLEQYADIDVYRVFAKIEADGDDDIDISDSQFSIDDWEFDGLEDNVVISGSMRQSETEFTLSIMLDNSLLEGIEDATFTYQYSELYLLINDLPRIAEAIIKSIKPDYNDNPELIITYDELGNSTEYLNEVISAVFYWNLDLYLHLWGVEWDDDDIESQFNEMLALCEKDKQAFSIWCMSMMAKQVMQVGLDAVGDVIVPLVDDIFNQHQNHITTAIIISQGLVNLGYIEEAIAIVEKQASTKSANPLIWITLTEMYMQANRFDNAIDANQRALEIGIQDEKLLWSYAQLLILAENNEWFVEELLHVAPDEVDEAEQVTHEIIICLENILELNPEHILARYRLLSYLINLESDAIWKHFEQLVQLDTESHYTRNIIDQLYEIDDLQPAFDILNNYAQTNPDNPTVFLNLAQLAILDENPDLAQGYLETCEQFLPQFGDTIELEIQRLKLSVEFTNFEQDYSEIKMILDAKNNISEHKVEFLEEAIEIAPKFGDLYVTLARCYLSWEDSTAALEVLNDAQERVGKHPLVIQTLAQVLWRTGERELAFKRLNEGLVVFPNDISLLTQIAGYLLDNNQLEDSKPFIERAEIIAPSHPLLWKLRKQITDKIS